MYLRTHYCTPCRAGLDLPLTALVTLYKWIEDNNTTRDKAYTLLKRHKLLCQYYKGRYYVCENPNNPIDITDLTTRKRTCRKRSNSRGRYQSEMEYYEKLANDVL